MAGNPPRPVPRLLGQEPTYLVSALHAYKRGERSNPTMRAAVAGLTDDQIELAALVLSGRQTRLPPISMAGAPPPPIVAGLCAGCHGQTGLGVVLEYPRIGGQRQDYMKAALADYQSGARSNPIMRTVARELTPDDIEQSTAYMAAHQGLYRPASGSAP